MITSPTINIKIWPCKTVQLWLKLLSYSLLRKRVLIRLKSNKRNKILYKIDFEFTFQNAHIYRVAIHYRIRS